MTRQVSSASRFVGDPDPHDPLVGARLRWALTHVEQCILSALEKAGFGDLQLAHFKVLRFPPPDGERPIDLAHRAGTSKQAMNYLLLQLEDMGYVQRSSGTARLVSLTEKGWEVARLQRATVRAIARDWRRKVGPQRFEAFCAVLEELTG